MKLFLSIQFIFFIGCIGCTVLSAHIIKRDTEKVGAQTEACLERLNVTREKLMQWNKQLIIGDDDDETIKMLRARCSDEMISLTMRTLKNELISEDKDYSPTAEEWRSYVGDIKEGILNSTNGEYREKVEASGDPTDKMIDDLRTTIVSMGSGYKNCEKHISFGPLSGDVFLVDLLNDRIMCMEKGEMLKDDIELFGNQMISGDDEETIRLRTQIVDMTIAIAIEAGAERNPDWNDTIVEATIGRVNETTWLEFINEMKLELINSTDAEHQQLLTQSNTQSDAMIDTLRRIVGSYATNFNHCETVRRNINAIRNIVKDDMNRTK